MARPTGTRNTKTELLNVIRSTRERLRAVDALIAAGKSTQANLDMALRLSNVITRASRDLEELRKHAHRHPLAAFENRTALLRERAHTFLVVLAVEALDH